MITGSPLRALSLHLAQKAIVLLIYPFPQAITGSSQHHSLLNSGVTPASRRGLFQSRRTRYVAHCSYLFFESPLVTHQLHTLPQEEFADIAGFSRSYFSEIETGKRNISVLNLIKIIEALNVDPNKIIGSP